MTNPNIKLYQDLIKSFIEVSVETKLLQPVVDKFGLTGNILEFCKMLLGVPQSDLKDFDELTLDEKLDIASMFNDNFLHWNRQGGPKSLSDERLYFLTSCCKMIAQYEIYPEAETRFAHSYIESNIVGWLMAEAEVWSELGFTDKPNVDRFRLKLEAMKSKITGN
jgi:hypothetical protein